jgi:predicted N-acetyltransferase YhbS
MKPNIRSEANNDFQLIKHVNDLAFGQPNEGELIDKLRTNPAFVKDLSMVAEFENQIVGHILFFPIQIFCENGTTETLALAPMSVLPEFQNKSIGSQLVIKGLEAAKKLGFKSVIVLGHPEFYPRFGFEPASRWKIKPPFEVPDEVFMAIELEKGSLENDSGIVRYPGEFDEVG